MLGSGNGNGLWRGQDSPLSISVFVEAVDEKTKLVFVMLFGAHKAFECHFDMLVSKVHALYDSVT